MDYKDLCPYFYVYDGKGGVRPDGKSLLLNGDILFREDTEGGARYTSSRGAVLEFGPDADVSGAGIRQHPLADGSAQGMYDLLSRLETQSAYRDADEYHVDRMAGRMAAFYATDRDGTTVSVERDSTGYAVVDGFHTAMEDADLGREYDFNPRSKRVYTMSAKARQRAYDAEDGAASPILGVAFSVRDMVERAAGRVPDTSPVQSLAADRVEAVSGMSLGRLTDMARNGVAWDARDLTVPGVSPGMAVFWADKHEKDGTCRAVVISNDAERGAGLIRVRPSEECRYGTALPAEGPLEGMSVAAYERDFRFLAPRDFDDLHIETMPGGNVGQDVLDRLTGRGPSGQAPRHAGARERMRPMSDHDFNEGPGDGSPSLGG